MNTLIHADIFFFVTTIVVVIVGLLLAIALIYFIKILYSVKRVAEEIRDETILFRQDVHELRDSIKREGFKLKNMFSFFTRFIPKNKDKKSK
jgi:hypothetical protein